MKFIRMATAVVSAAIATTATVVPATAITPEDFLAGYDRYVSSVSVAKCTDVKTRNNDVFEGRNISTTGDFLKVANIFLEHAKRHPSTITFEGKPGLLNSFSMQQREEFFRLYGKERNLAAQRLVECGVIVEGGVSAPERERPQQQPPHTSGTTPTFDPKPVSSSFLGSS